MVDKCRIKAAEHEERQKQLHMHTYSQSEKHDAGLQGTYIGTSVLYNTGILITLYSKDETCWKYSKLLQYIYFKCDDTAVNKKYKKDIDINKQHLLFKNI